jgi:hypothetical protein
MIKENNKDADLSQRRYTDTVLEKIPVEVKDSNWWRRMRRQILD